LVKRVIALPGDRIHLRNGIVYLNGVAQNEPEVPQPSAQASDPYMDNFPSVPPDWHPDVTASWAVSLAQAIQGGDVVVPPGSYFVMGDNREHILGSPLFVYWSFDMPENDELKPALSEQVGTMAQELIHFFGKTRWARTLHP